jgi:ATP-dependent Clp protease ATP-binding subunit ClpA
MPKIATLDPTRSGRQAEDLENKLHHLIVGQDEAIHHIVRAYQTHVAGLSPVGRPVGNFLFLGPTGSRNTRMKRAIERLLAQPLSNLMASGQIQRGDCIRVSHEAGSAALMFGREPETARVWEVAGRAA